MLPLVAYRDPLCDGRAASSRWRRARRIVSRETIPRGRREGRCLSPLTGAPLSRKRGEKMARVQVWAIWFWSASSPHHHSPTCSLLAQRTGPRDFSPLSRPPRSVFCSRLSCSSWCTSSLSTGIGWDESLATQQGLAGDRLDKAELVPVLDQPDLAIVPDLCQGIVDGVDVADREALQRVIQLQ